MRMRIHSREIYNRLKAATRRLIKCAGGVEAAAMDTRVSWANLSKYENINAEGVFMPLDVIADLETATGSYAVTEALAALHGAVLMHKPAADRDGVMTAHIAKVLKETGETVEAVGASISDGTIDRRERESIITQIDEAVHALMALRAHVDLCEGQTRPAPRTKEAAVRKQ